MSEPTDPLHEAACHDSTVNRMMSGGATLEHIVLALTKEKAAILKRAIELESIVPKRRRLPDGRVMIWHCPDNLIPEEKL